MVRARLRLSMTPARDARRVLPSVEAVLRQPALERAAGEVARPLLVEAVRAEIAAAREALRRNGALAPDAAELAAGAMRRAAAEARPALRRVLNATGIVLHTNLGR